MSTLGVIYIFLSKYLVPFLFAIGLIYFIYASIEYFIIGKGGDEGRAQHGRDLYLKSISWFVIAIVIHLMVLLFGWLSTLDLSGGVPQYPSGGGGVEIKRDQGILEVPNVPDVKY